MADQPIEYWNTPVPYAVAGADEMPERFLKDLEQFETLASDRSLDDPGPLLSLLWQDYGTPGANFNAQSTLLMILGHLDTAEFKRPERVAIRDCLIAYAYQGGLEQMTLQFFTGTSLAHALAHVTAPDDSEAQQLLLDISALVAACKEGRPSAEFMAEAGGLIGHNPGVLAETMLERQRALLDRLRAAFGDSLSPELYAELEHTYAADLDAAVDVLVHGATEREFHAVAPDVAAPDAATPEVGAPAPATSQPVKLRELARELQRLVEQRGDVARVTRVARWTAELRPHPRDGEQALRLMLVASRRVLERQRPPLDEGVLRALAAELCRIPQADTTRDRSANLWARAVGALGPRAEPEVVSELRRRVGAAQDAHVRKAMQAALERCERGRRPPPGSQPAAK